MTDTTQYFDSGDLSADLDEVRKASVDLRTVRSPAERQRISALRELVHLGDQTRQYPYSVILSTHGFVFEWTQIGWVERDQEYTKPHSVERRYQTRAERREYYLKQSYFNRFRPYRCQS